MSKYLKKPIATAASPSSSFANGASSPSPTRFNGAGSVSGLNYGSDAPNSFRSTPLRGSSTAIRGTSALERASMYLNTRARPLSTGATSPPTHRIDRTNAMPSAHTSRSSSRSSGHSSLRRTKPVLDRRTAPPAAVVVDDTDSSISLAASEIPSDTSIVLHNPPKIRSPTRPHPTSAAAILDRFRKPEKSPTPSVSTASRNASPAPASVAVPNEPSKDIVSDFSAFLNHMSDTSGVAKESVRLAVDKSIEGQSRSAVEILSSMRQPQQSSAIVSSVPVSTRRSCASSVPSSRRSSSASGRGKQSSAVASAISEEHSKAETSFGDVTSVIEEEGSEASAISESVVSLIASAASSDGSSCGSDVVSDVSGSRSAASSRVSSVRSRNSASSGAMSARSEATRSVATPEYSDDDESAVGEYEDDFDPSAATSPVKSSLVISLPAPAAKTLTPLPLATPATALAATPAVSHYAPLVGMMQHLSTAIQTLSTPSLPRPSTADSGISAPATCACAHHDTARTHAFNQLLLAQVHLVQHLMTVAAPPGVPGGGFRYTTLEDTREYLRRHRRPPLSMDEALAQVRWEEEREVERARGSRSAANEVKGRF
ncbi:hypothetical protein GGF31_004623 [Allomyces arbusculus]|nr:hypothetical protein GGF31_004623 [Allomyces arbusculus]